MSRRLTLSAALLLSWHLVTAAPSAAATFAPYTAHYRLYARGVPVGVGSISLRLDAGGGYRMRSQLRASGLAALLIDERLSEQAQGELLAAGPRPQRYIYRHSNGEERHARLDFVWDAGVVHSSYRGEARTLTLSPEAVDPLSVYLWVSWQLQNGHSPDAVTLVRNNEITRYRLEALGEEILAGPDGQDLNTRVFTRRRPGSRRRTTFWLAPAHGYLPAQVVQHKDGGENLRLRLIRIER